MLAKLKNKLITDLSINIYRCSDLFSFGTSGLNKHHKEFFDPASDGWTT